MSLSLAIKTTINILALLVLPQLFSLPAFAADAKTGADVLPAHIQFVRDVEGIREYLLPNGLRLLLVPDASKPTTTVNITYLVGSRHENYGETGMAHLLEHLMFKGSQAHPKLWEEMSQRGVSFNGTTWLDRTNYYETFPANPDTLAWAIAMEADRMVNSRISGDDLKTEFSVVRNEMEKGENSPTSALIARVTSAAYLWHNYGKNTIGARSDVENVDIHRLQAFWRKYYQPDNAVLTVAGDFDAKQVLTLVEQHFSKIPKPQRTIEATYTLDPVQDGERDVTVRRVGDSQALAALYHTVPAAHPDYAATEALALILGDSPNGRLYKALVANGKATSVFSWAASMEEPGFLMFGAQLRSEENITEAKKIMLDVIEGLTKQPIAQEELTRAKTALASNIAQTYNDAERLAIALSDSIGQGDWRLFFLLRDRIQALTLADVQRVAQTWLKSSNRTTGSFLPTAQPDRVPMSAKVDIAKQLETFKPGPAPAKAENFIATPENIDRRTQIGQLSNGMKYALLPKTTRGSTVVISLVLHTGNLDNLKGQSGAAALAAAMLNRGTENLNYQKFTEELDNLKTQLYISGSAMGVRVEAQTIKENLPRVLDLIHDALRKSAFVESEFNQLVNRTMMQLEESRFDPQVIAMDLVGKQLNHWTSEDPRYYRNTAEKIEQLKTVRLADAKNFWQSYYGTNYAEISLVGDFDAAEVKTALQNRFGDWYAKNIYQRVPNPYQAALPQALKEKVADKANAFFSGSLPLQLTDSHPDYPALFLANYLLGGRPNARLSERIRQKEGISYGVGSDLVVSATDDMAMFSVFAIFAPQNLNRLEKAINEEITRAVEEGFSQEEIEQGKKSLLQQLQLARSQDTRLAARLSRNLDLGRTMQHAAELEKKILALDSRAVHAVTKKYLAYAKLVRATAGDFK